jgi:hypothetical protein
VILAVGQEPQGIETGSSSSIPVGRITRGGWCPALRRRTAPDSAVISR